MKDDFRIVSFSLKESFRQIAKQMKLHKKAILIILIIGSSIFCFSQNKDDEKAIHRASQLIGLQFNPYISSKTFNSEDWRQYVFAGRYGFIFRSGFSIGPEISGSFYKQSVSKGNTIKYGLFSRYTFLTGKSISPFLELSGYYQTSKTWIIDEGYIHDGQNTLIYNKFSYYVASGASVNLYKNSLRLDLMIKFSTDKIINGSQIVPSFRLNYYF